MSEVPPSDTMVCRPDGKHYAVCPSCREEIEVPVIERENPGAKFVLSQKFDAETSKWVEDEVTYGTVAEYDLSGYEAHYSEAH